MPKEQRGVGMRLSFASPTSTRIVHRLFPSWNDLKYVLKYDKGVFPSEWREMPLSCPTGWKLVSLTRELARSDLLAAGEELVTGSKVPSYLLQLGELGLHTFVHR